MSKRLPCLDRISLDCMEYATHELRVRRTKANVQDCAKLQIAIREAIRAFLPPDDPRRDPDYPFNQPGE